MTALIICPPRTWRVAVLDHVAVHERDGSPCDAVVLVDGNDVATPAQDPRARRERVMLALHVRDMPGLAEAGRRDEILDWVRAHGLDPHRVFAVTVVGPLLWVREYKCDADGRKLLNAARTAPLVRRRLLWLRRRPPRLAPP